MPTTRGGGDSRTEEWQEAAGTTETGQNKSSTEVASGPGEGEGGSPSPKGDAAQPRE